MVVIRKSGNVTDPVLILTALIPTPVSVGWIAVSGIGSIHPVLIFPEFVSITIDSSVPLAINGNSVVSPERDIMAHDSVDSSVAPVPIRDTTSSVTETIGALESDITSPVASNIQVFDTGMVCSVVEIFSPLPVRTHEFVATTSCGFSTIEPVVTTGIVSATILVSASTGVSIIG